MILTESMTPSTFRVFLRGNPLSRGEEVSPRFLSAVPPHDTKPFRDGQRRLGLAQAIVAPENPLTRRVVVNWIWRNHFGLGLVRTPDDFGTRGTPPTHPHLLDYLASVFADDGWSIKKMHRRIMLSDVYQQGSIENTRSREIDPENRLLWRMPRKRLEMEAMRDAMLAVSGELDCSRLGEDHSTLKRIRSFLDEVCTDSSIATSFRILPARLMERTRHRARLNAPTQLCHSKHSTS